MERSEKMDADLRAFVASFAGNELDATLRKIRRLMIDGCSGRKIHYAAHVIGVGKKLWLSSGAKVTRSTWCTTCAAAGKCASFTLRVLTKMEESPIVSFAKFRRNIRSSH